MSHPKWSDHPQWKANCESIAAMHQKIAYMSHAQVEIALMVGDLKRAIHWQKMRRLDYMNARQYLDMAIDARKKEL